MCYSVQRKGLSLNVVINSTTEIDTRVSETEYNINHRALICFQVDKRRSPSALSGAHKCPALATRSLLSFSILNSTLLRGVEV